MNLTCPLCYRPGISSEWHLRKHLEGKTGKHGLTPEEADLAIARAPRGFVLPSSQSEISEPISPMNVENLDEMNVQPIDPHIAFTKDLFRQLAANKGLPKYQFERRIDAIIAVFLPEIIKKCLGWSVEIVLPEFPIKKLDNNQSTNVDYLLFRHGNTEVDDAWVFFELKTDCGSVRSEQWNIYVDAAKRGMPALLEELNAIVRATKQSRKYNELVRQLGERRKDCPIEILYLSPGPDTIFGLPSSIRVILFDRLSKLELDKHSEVWDLFRSIILPKLC